MLGKIATSVSQTIYRLGVWYSGYRLIIAVSLLLIYLLTAEQLSGNYVYPFLYFYTLICYITFNIFQLALLQLVPIHISKQLIFIFLIDVICLSLITFASGGPNLQLSLLYVIIIFSSALLLNAHLSLIITLFAVIMVVYQRFLGDFFDANNLTHLGNSVFLAFLFFVVHAIGRIAVQRFKILETLTFNQSIEIHQLQNINRYILEQIEDGYLVLDESNHIVLTNPAANTLLGIHLPTSLEKTPLIKLQPDLFELIQFSKLEDGEEFSFESQQSPYTINVRVKHLVVPEQALVLLVLKDAQKLTQQVQQLKLAALGQLSASIAHEIRNPLAAIVQANELLKDSDAHQLSMLSHMISKQAKRIDNIVQDTLAMARNKPTEPQVIELSAFFASLLNEDLADAKHRIQLKQAEQLSILFDEKQLRQVLINLIRNALRHNSTDAPYIEVEVQLKDGRTCIDVIDFGTGVSKRDISQLFKPFFSTEIKGTGLGLYLSHTFCEANHAKLTYIERQQGACFRIECSKIH
ncbi:sensor histidine kinase [Acinetobacter colistiniresistens]|uniref:histidine kinase n=1 Tax=Acinetobacter colistiniresistens TaxID=280145 RepID=S3U8B2_9GAMM|nr:ATP-binding protein [Acinetobacter colistiniresistens]EPG35692.1 two-component system, NtrC family, sensor histidine kinase PilS [Acinetobacter colistiniresistens]TVT87374.1 PAS domain-containing protein [Acinetobacter colistiniresistens]